MKKPSRTRTTRTPAPTIAPKSPATRRRRPSGPTFEEVWRLREEERLPALLGPLEPGIVTLDQVPSLSEPYADWDPLWSSFGVRRAATTALRKTWLYVTSGLTTPTYFARAATMNTKGARSPSGCGYEITLETPKDADWPALRLLSMMAYTLGTRRTFAPGHRWPFGGPVDGKRSSIVACVFVEDGEFVLPTGRAALLRAVGITAPELAFAKELGSEALVRLLEAGPGLVTSLRRPSVV